MLLPELVDTMDIISEMSAAEQTKINKELKRMILALKQKEDFDKNESGFTNTIKWK